MSAISKEAQDLFNKLSRVDTGLCRYTAQKCEEIYPKIKRINELKKELGAVILAHSYVSSEIAYGVADEIGDSYMLSKKALESTSQTIVFVAVRFMAETAKILNPKKRVIQPNLEGGCSLADSITAKDVYKLKEQYPEHSFVCYINTTAAVKAACDVCVTSSNVYTIIENLSKDKIYFLPDRLMAENIIAHCKKKGLKKEILYSSGSCYVHEQYDPEMIDYTRLIHPNLGVAVHPECAPSLTEKADFVGSTEGIYNFVKDTHYENYLLITECGLSSRVQAELENKRIVGTCSFCKYMRHNDLDAIISALEDKTGAYDIELSAQDIKGARNCIDKMFELAELAPPSSLSKS